MKIEKLQKSLSEEDLDTFIALENSKYLANTPAALVVIVTEEKTILVCGRLDYDKAKRESEIKDIRTFAKTEIPVREGERIIFGEPGEVIGKILEELDSTRIGYDKTSGKILEKIKKKYEANYQEKPDLIWDLRKIKTEEEIENLKKSAEIASEGMKNAKELIEPGRTENEIVGEIEYKMRKLGSQGVPFDTIVASGNDSFLPHAEPSDRKLGEEELIVVDLGARWKRYKSDMSRTFAISPNSKQKEVLKIVKEAQKASLSKVEAGVEVKGIEKAARKVFRKHDLEEFYLHGLGHGVGLDTHEPPNISVSSEEKLEENMVVTIEPGIYIQEIGGCRLEDMILVEEDGYEKLTSV